MAELEKVLGIDLVDQIDKDMFRGHGSPYDRGSADSYYRRRPKPHWFPNGTYNDPEIKESDMSPFEVAEYWRGYNDNEEAGDFKEY